MTSRNSRYGFPTPQLWHVLMLLLVIYAARTVWTRSKAQQLDGAWRREEVSPARRTQSLERAVERGAEAIPELIEGLSKKSARIRNSAVMALGRIGPPAHAAVPALIHCLSDPDQEVRTSAADALPLIDPDHPDIVPALIERLGDRAEVVREEAAQALCEIGSASFPAVCRQIESRNPDVRLCVLSILQKMPWSVWRVSDEDRERMTATLRKAVSDSDDAVRARAFQMFSPVARPLRPEDIRRGLSEQDKRILLVALAHAARLGPAATFAVPKLIPLLDHEDTEVKLSALEAVGRIGPLAHTAIARTTALLQNDKLEVCLAAARALHRIGAPSDRILPRLLELFWKVETKDADSVAAVMVEIDGQDDAVVSCLMTMLRNTDRVESYNAAPKLRNSNPHAAQALVPDLVQRLQHSQAAVREAAVFDLYALGPAASRAVPALIEALGDSDDQVRILAAAALGEIGPEAKSAVPALLSRLKKESQTPQANSTFSRVPEIAAALMKIDPQYRSQIPHAWLPEQLVEAKQEPDR